MRADRSRREWRSRKRDPGHRLWLSGDAFFQRDWSEEPSVAEGVIILRMRRFRGKWSERYEIFSGYLADGIGLNPWNNRCGETENLNRA
jgi:hypothetical protein